MGKNLAAGTTIVILVAIVFFAIFGVKGCVNGFVPNYSDGERSGQVFKLSRKGIVWKSYEGELKLSDFQLHGNIDSSSSNGQNLWTFSVKDEETAKRVQQALETGKRVTLHYHQYLISPLNQDSNYTVDGVIESDH